MHRRPRPRASFLLAGVTKGSLVSHIIQHHSSRGGADFVLCLGDDSMDEDMFNVVRDYQVPGAICSLLRIYRLLEFVPCFVVPSCCW